MNNVAQNDEKSIVGAIKIDENEVQEHLNTLVKESVEEVLNKLLNVEADAICKASRYERNPDHLDRVRRIHLRPAESPCPEKVTEQFTRHIHNPPSEPEQVPGDDLF